MRIIRLLLAPVLFVVVALLVQPPHVYAQTPAGTEFMVPLPAVMSTYERNDTSFKFRIEVFCSRKTKLSVRWGNGQYIVQDAILNAGERIVVMKPQFELFAILQSDIRGLSDSINTKAFWVTSDEPVSVHATFDKNNRSETYTAMPTSAYDTTYTVVNYSGYAQGSDRGGIVITAATDNTQVTITPGVDVYTKPEHLKNVPYTVTLQKQQVYQVMANDSKSGQLADLTGTVIRSTKPIGVLCFMKATNVPLTKWPEDTVPPMTTFPEGNYRAKTIMNPQLPNSKAGTVFYAVPFARQGKSRIRLVATQFGTTFSINRVHASMQLGGRKAIDTFNTGAYLDTVITGPTVIEASKPVVAMQLAYSSDLTSFDTVVVRKDQPDVTVKIPYGDPMMVFLPPVDQYIRSAQWISPQYDIRPPMIGSPPLVFFWEHYVTIIAPVEARGNVMLDGQPVDFPLSFPGGQPGSGKYIGAVVRVTPAPHKVESDYPVNVIAHGFTWNDSYGMNAGESVRAIGKSGIDTLRFTTCQRDFDTTFGFSNLGNVVMRIDTITISGLNGSVISPHPATLPQAVIAGRSRDIVLSFDLPTPGTYTGVIRIVTDANNRKVFEIPVIATRDSSRLAAPTTIDFGVIGSSVSTYDTTVVIRNGGTQPITLTAADITGDGFEVLSPSLPHTVAPGSADSLRVRITPNNGLREGKLTLRGTPCLTGFEIELRGFQGGGANLLVRRSIDYPQFLCTAPSLVDSLLVIRSVGDEPVSITTATMKGTNPGDFMLVDDPVALSPILPGDSMQIRVRFIPQGFGPRTASLEMTTNTVNAPTLTIALRGRKDIATLETSLSAIDFGRVRSCDAAIDTLLTLSNNGSVPDTITALDFGGVSGYTVTPSLPIIVHPGSPQTLHVQFAPATNSTFATTLRIVGSVCGTEGTITLNGERVAPSLSVSTTALRFDTVYACDAGAVTRKIGVKNDGVLADTIVSATVAGNSGFAVQPLTTPIVLQPGQSDSITVTFTPGGSGSYIGTVVLEWGPCGQTNSIDIQGEVVSPSLDISVTDIDFGPVRVGSSSRQGILVENTGTVPRTISEADLSGVSGVRLVSPTLPIVLQPGDRVTLEVEYTPVVEGEAITGTARIVINDPCGEERVMNVKGSGIGEDIIRARLTVAVPETVSGMVDEDVSIPIEIKESSKLAEAQAVGLRVVLRYNYTMLKPLGVTTSVPGLTASLVSEKIEGKDRVVEVMVSGGQLPESGEVMRVQHHVLLGDAEETGVKIDTVGVTVQQAKGIVSVSREEGRFVVTGVCETGGSSRLVQLKGAALKSVRPNPIRSEAEVWYDVMESGTDVEIVLLDSRGTEVSQVVSGEYGIGRHVAVIDGSRLPSGVYYCELRSRGERMRISVLLVK